jgi:hypothetical protein
MSPLQFYKMLKGTDLSALTADQQTAIKKRKDLLAIVAMSKASNASSAGNIRSAASTPEIVVPTLVRTMEKEKETAFGSTSARAPYITRTRVSSQK